MGRRSEAEPIEELGILGTNPFDRCTQPLRSARDVLGDCGSSDLLHRASLLLGLAPKRGRLVVAQSKIHRHARNGTRAVPLTRGLDVARMAQCSPMHPEECKTE